MAPIIGLHVAQNLIQTLLNKLKIVAEEVDESMFWLEMFKRTEVDNQITIEKLWKEANELLAITVSSINTVRKRLN